MVDLWFLHVADLLALVVADLMAVFVAKFLDPLAATSLRNRIRVGSWLKQMLVHV